MNFFGIGNLEIGLILLVAVMVLGPERMVEIARDAGKIYRKARRFLHDVTAYATVDLDNKGAAQNSGGATQDVEPAAEPEKVA